MQKRKKAHGANLPSTYGLALDLGLKTAEPQVSLGPKVPVSGLFSRYARVPRARQLSWRGGNFGGNFNLAACKTFAQQGLRRAVH